MIDDQIVAHFKNRIVFMQPPKKIIVIECLTFSVVFVKTADFIKEVFIHHGAEVKSRSGGNRPTTGNMVVHGGMTVPAFMLDAPCRGDDVTFRSRSLKFFLHLIENGFSMSNFRAGQNNDLTGGYFNSPIVRNFPGSVSVLPDVSSTA